MAVNGGNGNRDHYHPLDVRPTGRLDQVRVILALNGRKRVAASWRDDICGRYDRPNPLQRRGDALRVPQIAVHDLDPVAFEIVMRCRASDKSTNWLRTLCQLERDTRTNIAGSTDNENH